MPPSSPILIETQRVTSDTLHGFLDALGGCWKSTSLLWMQANGFPVLPGIILSGWTSHSESAVQRFCREKGFSELLVRIEKPGQRWTQRRGGYTIPIDQVQHQVQELANEGMLTILLEPASPYLDLFSLTSACDLATGKVDVEVVGTGFDASDLLRSDILPHERFEVSFGSRERKAAGPPSFKPERLHLIGREDYQASVKRRLHKIGARLRNPSFTDDSVGPGVSEAEREGLIEEAVKFLQASGQTTLLDRAEEYQPIRPPLLNLFLGELFRVIERVRASKILWRTLSLSATFLRQDRLVIWDFFVPRENDTSSLSVI